MNRRTAIRQLATFFLTTASLAEAQQQTKIPRIGFLVARSPSANVDRIEAFRQGLRELGYVEGKTLSLSGDFGRERLIAFPRSRPS